MTSSWTTRFAITAALLLGPGLLLSQLPPPVIVSFEPETGLAGGPDFDLVIDGAGFGFGTTAIWNTTRLVTALISPTQVVARVPAALVALPGQARIQIVVGAQPSKPVPYDIVKRVAIIGFDPPVAVPGGLGFQLLVNGVCFADSSIVTWDQTQLPTQFLNPNQLIGTVSAALIAQPGQVQIQVVTPGGEDSEPVPYDIQPLLGITTPEVLPGGAVGIPYETQLAAQGGTPPLMWFLNSPFDALPLGLNLNPLTGVISGTPGAERTSRFNIRVVDAQGAAAFKQFELTVSQPLVITTAAVLPPGTVGEGYAANLAAAGGIPPYSWSVVGGILPPGLHLDPDTGAIDGVATSTGLFRWRARVTDSAGMSAVNSFRIAIGQDPALPSSLGTRPNRFVFPAVVGAAPMTRLLQVTNEGGGPLRFQVTTPGKGLASFLTVTPSAGVATAAEPVGITVTADPSEFAAGTYFAELELTTVEKGGAGPMTLTVPVAMAVSDETRSLRLSQRGMTFSGLAGGSGPPPQSFDVLNDGFGQMVWNQQVTTLTGGNWLFATPTNGISDAGQGSPVQVQVNPLALPPGSYYGLIGVGADDAANSPQFLTVVLNWQQADGLSRINVAPEGLIFVDDQPNRGPAARQVELTNTGLDPVSFTLEALTFAGLPWLSASLPGGEVSSGEPLLIDVAVNTKGLAPGTYEGLLLFSFDDATSRSVDVILVIPDAGGGIVARDQGPSLAAAGPKGGGCVRTRVDPVFTVLAGTLPLPAGWPASIEVDVGDNCGAKMQLGSVVVDFANISSPSLALSHVGTGLWTTTWNTPSIPQESMAAVTVTAADLGGFTGTFTKALAVTPAAALVPRVFEGGVVHSASFIADPLAPGTIVAIVGENLSSELRPGDGTVGGAIATVLPLPTELGSTQITLGGEALPLLFSREDQVNAVLPFEVADRINQGLPLLVRRTDFGSIAVSEPVFITEARPGIFTQNAAGFGPAIVQDIGFQLVTAANPVGEGEVVIIYCAGLGEVNPAVATGAAAAVAPLSFTVDAVTVTIGGVPAAVGFSGLAPGFASLYQINAIVPAGVAPGEVEMVVTIAGQTSTVVTVFVQ